MRFLHSLTAAAAFIALPGAFITGSCGLVLDTFEKVDGGTEEVDASADGGPACVHQSFPPLPMGIADTGGVDFTVAVRSIDFGESASKEEPVGLDLDKTCTCLGEGASCLYPKWADKDHCDGRNGVDNAGAQVFESIVAAVGDAGFGSAFYSKKAEEGEWSLLLRVTGYNGLENDPKVTLIIYATPGYGPGSGAGGGGGSGLEQDPKWDGTDAWPVSGNSLVDGMSYDMPKYVDTFAYVSEGTLVANLTEATIDFNGDTSHLGVKLTAGTVMGSIQNPAADKLGWRIVNGVLAGRWRSEDLFDGLGTFTADGQSLCNDQGFIYKQFKKTLCGYIDIASTLGGPTLQCDSLSFGMKFTTHPALLGALYTPPALVSTCPMGQNPADDGCENL
jgi:hypothetical protein